jgi:hypothetical protein
MSVNYRSTLSTEVFDAQSSDTVSAQFKVKNTDYIVLEVATAASTDGSLLIRGSMNAGADLTSASSVSNRWSYVHSYNLNNPGAGVAGSTGHSLGASANAMIKVNVDQLYFVALEISGIGAGAYTAYVYGIQVDGS